MKESQTGPLMRRKKKLMRNPRDRLVGGVCGGVADFLGARPNRIRLIGLVVLLLPTAGIGPILYVLLWLFLPVGTQAEGIHREPIIRSKARRRVKS